MIKSLCAFFFAAIFLIFSPAVLAVETGPPGFEEQTDIQNGTVILAEMAAFHERLPLLPGAVDALGNSNSHVVQTVAISGSPAFPLGGAEAVGHSSNPLLTQT